MHIRVNAIRVKPEQRELYRKMLKEETEQVQALEPRDRTRNYYFMQDEKDPNTFLMFAVFADEAAFDEHVASPHFQHYLRQMKDLGIERERIGSWRASNIAPDDRNWR
jgi:4-carboxymuconolactone decarboxylase